ncbi:unnamed protein product [Prorocentrum cordatum]|uniref:Uncharacterized protein n=1 Tax=Prorocentrum cordatum TaxID=2364126 RepID=A0ABN9T8M0_9DINO|nr:unnamed protein product [Polarella glacialis]
MWHPSLQILQRRPGWDGEREKGSRAERGGSAASGRQACKSHTSPIQIRKRGRGNPIVQKSFCKSVATLHRDMSVHVSGALVEFERASNKHYGETEEWGGKDGYEEEEEGCGRTQDASLRPSASLRAGIPPNNSARRGRSRQTCAARKHKLNTGTLWAWRPQHARSDALSLESTSRACRVRETPKNAPSDVWAQPPLPRRAPSARAPHVAGARRGTGGLRRGACRGSLRRRGAASALAVRMARCRAPGPQKPYILCGTLASGKGSRPLGLRSGKSQIVGCLGSEVARRGPGPPGFRTILGPRPRERAVETTGGVPWGPESWDRLGPWALSAAHRLIASGKQEARFGKPCAQTCGHQRSGDPDGPALKGTRAKVICVPQPALALQGS